MGRAVGHNEERTDDDQCGQPCEHNHSLPFHAALTGTQQVIIQTRISLGKRVIYEWLRSVGGDCLLITDEASPGGGPGKFKCGGFDLAIQCDALVLDVRFGKRGPRFLRF